MFENVNFAFLYFSLYFFLSLYKLQLALDRNNRFSLVDYLQIFMYL